MCWVVLICGGRRGGERCKPRRNRPEYCYIVIAVKSCRGSRDRIGTSETWRTNGFLSKTSWLYDLRGRVDRIPRLQSMKKIGHRGFQLFESTEFSMNVRSVGWKWKYLLTGFEKVSLNRRNDRSRRATAVLFLKTHCLVPNSQYRILCSRFINNWLFWVPNRNSIIICLRYQNALQLLCSRLDREMYLWV